MPDTKTEHNLDPRYLAHDDGEARWWGRGLAVIKATGADTGGQMTIIEVTEPPGAESPLHVHHREDEAFWIIEGDVTFDVGDDVIEAHTGDYAFGPRDIPHRYTVGPNGCRMLFLCTPAGFENLVRAVSVPAKERKLPSDSDQEPNHPDPDRAAAAIEAHGCEVLA